ncbi:MAG: SprB repeat-containing protein, partial [Bacteroidales bacterium]|nr:SprB repeat-containing protein [Bacteroidales bacterium]
MNVVPTSTTTYTIIELTDANCTSNTPISSVVTVNEIPVVQMAANVGVCLGDQVTVTPLSVSGGTPAYEYSWNGGAFSADDTYIINSLTADTDVSLQVRDANACQSAVYDEHIIAEPLPQVNFVGTTSICQGESTSLTITPGTASYEWSNGLGTSQTVTVTPASTETYYVTATSNGCTNVGSVVVIVNDPPELEITASATEINCYTPYITLAATGLSASYVWSNGIYSETNSVYVPGTYSVVATDLSGCTSSASITLTEDVALPPAAITNNTGSTSLNCNYQVISLSASGGVLYQWSNGIYDADAIFNAAGTYTVTVTGVNGCTASADITITRPDDLTILVDYDDILCHDGTTAVVISANGGTAPYTGTGTFAGVSSGVHTYTITDSDGCSATQLVSIANPQQLVPSVTSTPILCNGETSTVTISASGGNAPYQGIGTQVTYSGTYTYTVYDANGCASSVDYTVTQPDALNVIEGIVAAPCFGSNATASLTVEGGTLPYLITWQDGSTAMSNSNIMPDVTFTYYVVDANGCRVNGSIVASQPEIMQIQLTPTDVSCFGSSDGAITASVTGGTMPYTYQWNASYQGTSLVNLNPFDYTLTVTDSNGCTSSASATVGEPMPLGINLSPTDVQCGNILGSIDANVTGGNPEYLYSWSNGYVTTSSRASALNVGNYTLTVSDARGCTATAATSINLSGHIDAQAVVVSAPRCQGEMNGVVQAVSNMGTAPFLYMWNNGASTQSIMGLGEGFYSVSMTDVWGCSGSATVEVVAPASLSATIVATDARCFNTNDGKVNVTVIGGTVPYTFEWSSPNVSGSSSESVPLGVYTLTVTDFNGCELVENVEIKAPEEIKIDMDIVGISCFGRNDGRVAVSVSGGVSPFHTFLSNGFVQESDKDEFIHLPEGAYEITVT